MLQTAWASYRELISTQIAIGTTTTTQLAMWQLGTPIIEPGIWAAKTAKAAVC